MEVITCKKCGKLFNYVSGDRICPSCMKALDEKFAEVKKFVYDNPRVGINELAEQTGVSIRMIKRWIREERLCFTEDSPVGIECEKCGATIKTGRFCKSCKDKISNEMMDAAGLKRSATVEPKVRTSGENKMRFLN